MNHDHPITKYGDHLVGQLANTNYIFGCVILSGVEQCSLWHVKSWITIILSVVFLSENMNTLICFLALVAGDPSVTLITLIWDMRGSLCFWVVMITQSQNAEIILLGN